MTRYNVVLCVVDDAPIDTLDYMPWLTALDDAVVFPNSFLVQPLCTPSRVTTWTGRWPSSHGVGENDDASTFDMGLGFARVLQRVGVATMHAGKVLNEWPFVGTAAPNPIGFDESYSLQMFDGKSDYRNYKLIENGTEVSYGDTDADYLTDVMADKAVDFVGRVPEPWFVQLDNFAPHPTNANSGTYPATRHASLYSDVDMVAARRPNFNEADISDKPSWLQDAKPSQMNGTVAGNADNHKLNAWRCLKAVDEQLEAIKDAIDARDATMWDRTVVIFYADNANSFGEHRLWTSGRTGTKGFVYDEAIAMSLLIRHPDAAVSSVSSLASNVDIASTILELSRGRLPIAPQGQSLLPAVLGTNVNTRDALLMSAVSGGSLLSDPWDAVRTATEKYVEYSTDETERYDLSADPYELVNVAASTDNTELAATLAKLKAQVT